MVEPSSLVVQSWIDVQCTSTEKWYPAKIVEEEDKRVLVQFYGMGERHNEWVDKVRVWHHFSGLPLFV